MSLHLPFKRLNSRKPKPVLERDVSVDSVEILYEDESVMAVNKPACLPMHANLDPQREHLVGILTRQLERRDGSCGYLGVHQRLDWGTSGVVLFTRAKLIYRNIQRNREMQAVTDRDSLLIGLLLTDKTFARLISQTDVLCPGQHPYQVSLLIHHADPCLHGLSRVFVSDFLSFKIHVAIVNGIHAGQHLAEGALTGAILTDDGDNLFIVDFKIYVVDGDEIAEALGRPIESEYCLAAHCHSPACTYGVITHSDDHS